METVEVVIKIPKYTFEDTRRFQECIAEYVRKGTVLPKGHGRLIDADEYESDVLSIRELEPDKMLEYLDDAETIIEADTESRE